LRWEIVADGHLARRDGNEDSRVEPEREPGIECIQIPQLRQEHDRRDRRLGPHLHVSSCGHTRHSGDADGLGEAPLDRLVPYPCPQEEPAAKGVCAHIGVVFGVRDRCLTVDGKVDSGDEPRVHSEPKVLAHARGQPDVEQAGEPGPDEHAGLEVTRRARVLTRLLLVVGHGVTLSRILGANQPSTVGARARRPREEERRAWGLLCGSAAGDRSYRAEHEGAEPTWGVTHTGSRCERPAEDSTN
jgi:hypothetical protein